MRLTTEEMQDCIAQATDQSAEGLSGIELTVYRYMMAHPDATVDDIAEYTYKWDKYVPSDYVISPAKTDMSLEEERRRNQLWHDYQLSQEWRNEIQSIMEKVG